MISPNLHGTLGKEWIRARGSSVCCRSAAMGGHDTGESLKTGWPGTKWEGEQASHQLSVLSNSVGDNKVLVFICDDCEDTIRGVSSDLARH